MQRKLPVTGGASFPLKQLQLTVFEFLPMALAFHAVQMPEGSVCMGFKRCRMVDAWVKHG